MIVRYEVFNSDKGENPGIIRECANNFANRVLAACIYNDIINITESTMNWCYSVTVWYEADKEVAV